MSSKLAIPLPTNHPIAKKTMLYRLKAKCKEKRSPITDHQEHSPDNGNAGGVSTCKSCLSS
jgi:hypothetical protein